MKVYVLGMVREKDVTFSHIVGVYTEKRFATAMAGYETKRLEGKYTPKINEYVLDESEGLVNAQILSDLIQHI